MLPLRIILLSLFVFTATVTMTSPSEACPGNCLGKECGSDGCGGSCGVCPPGEGCDPTDGMCYATCNPWCESEGRECGPDGCGGSCGSCAAGQSCWEGTCIGECAPQCGGKICGDDGCGGSCGWCPQDLYCVSGQCVDASQCTPDCMMVTADGLAPKHCGSDGCGGECGLCLGNYVCDEFNFVCVECGSPAFPCPDPETDPPPDRPCEPTCVGAECGPDGCGGTCGECGFGQTCSHGVCMNCTPMCVNTGAACPPNGQCEVGGCNPQSGFCEIPRLCGGDGCGGTCGLCEPGSSCIDGSCTATGPCESDCVGKACGGDGCGNLCGQCPAGHICDVDGQCSDPNTSSWSSACPEGQTWDDLVQDCVTAANEFSLDSDAGCAAHTGHTGVLAGLLALLALAWRRRRV